MYNYADVREVHLENLIKNGTRNSSGEIIASIKNSADKIHFYAQLLLNPPSGLRYHWNLGQTKRIASALIDITY